MVKDNSFGQMALLMKGMCSKSEREWLQVPGTHYFLSFHPSVNFEMGNVKGRVSTNSVTGVATKVRGETADTLALESARGKMDDVTKGE
jgi:hypothetical protein